MYITWRKLITSNSNKMANKTYKKTYKNKLRLVTDVDEPKTSSLVKPRRLNNFIVKFQNLKHKLLSSEPTKRTLIWKITYLKSDFFSRKGWNKSHQNLSNMLLGSRKT